MTGKERVILGIDPGYDRCGWAVLLAVGNTSKVLAGDCLTTSSKLEKVERFRIIWDFFQKLVKEYSVQELAMESLFFSRNVSTALPVSEVRGMLCALAFENALSLSEYSPQQVKLAVTGYGKADKHQVTSMVVRLLRLENIPKIDDTGDAFAVALTHLAHARQHPGL